MYLKRLESVGFKSFAERIKVDFVPGVTAVVGPNGSGKSNITEAIRWVLGEQSVRSLRGSKMEDVIFQGSDSRRSLNVAEVNLVLDNSDHVLELDYNEVSVTRRVYRSGESEFYLNGQSCRLKDIVDLFMDSGLGRESFSIISQGRIEEILSTKAEERRTIFEEAAGVLKYKQRKRKAEYKLEETQENLNRVEDIIQEIEQQIEPLKEQAETARKYQTKQDELKQLEISLIITEIEQVHNEWQTLLDELENDRQKELEQKTSIQTKEAELEQERQDLEKLDKAIEEKQSNLLTVTEKLERYEGKKQVYHERTRNLTENIENLKTQKADTLERLKSIEDNVKSEKDILNSLQQKRDSTKEKINELESKLENSHESIAKKIENLKTEVIEYLNEQAAKRNEQQSIQQQLDQLTSKQNKQTEQYNDLLEKQQKLKNEYAEKQSDYHNQEKVYENLASTIKQEKEKLDQERRNLEECQSNFNQVQQSVEKLKSKQEMLEDMRDEYQGFFNGVKAILQAKKQGKITGTHGAIIELLNIPKEYLTAIETVLGSQAQHVVVDDNKTARAAINWLKKSNNGRATFLPLDTIQQRFIQRSKLLKVKNQSGFVGIAENLVSSDPQYYRAINHLMGHVLVARTLKEAHNIAEDIERKYRIVTLEGDVVNPGGSMSGGARNNKKYSLFTREKDLQDITEKLQDAEKSSHELKQQVSEYEQSINHLIETIEKKENQLLREQDKRQSFYETFQDKKLELESVQQNLERLNQDKSQLSQEKEDLQSRYEQLTQGLEAIDKQINESQQNIDKLTEQKDHFQASQDQLKDDYHKEQVTLAEQEERLKNQEDKVNELEQELENAHEQYKKQTSDLQEMQNQLESEETEDTIDAVISKAKEDKESITQTIQNWRSDRSERTQKLQDQERELSEEKKQNQTFKETIQEKDVKANRLDVSLENHLSKLQKEYTMTFEKAKQNYEKTDDLEKTREMVQSTKQSLEQMGAVNLGAIDEYKRISERYEFLTGQRNDLVNAKETLHNVIAEMDEEVEKRFSETFQQIKQAFTIVFKQLFGGGKADLKLTDPDDLLNTGVDIIAQPPGKKLQHLGLLSGGERSLTAIALLFSILRVRPVPFCVLDEVESSLDEANIVRFAQYLQTYSPDTQFIVITHRKGTMEQADVLYGITMQEPGVSRLVSVRLEEADELINA